MQGNKEIKVCGNCNQFDARLASGKPFGNSNLKIGGFTKIGICRVGGGIVNRNDACRKPPDVNVAKSIKSKILP